MYVRAGRPAKKKEDNSEEWIDMFCYKNGSIKEFKNKGTENKATANTSLVFQQNRETMVL